jgi:hypothetical protein
MATLHDSAEDVNPILIPDHYPDEALELPEEGGRGPGLADLVGIEADRYRSRRTPLGDLLAQTLECLALRLRMCDAEDPETASVLLDRLEEDIRADWYDRGLCDGRESVYATCRCGMELYR